MQCSSCNFRIVRISPAFDVTIFSSLSITRLQLRDGRLSARRVCTIISRLRLMSVVYMFEGGVDVREEDAWNLFSEHYTPYRIDQNAWPMHSSISDEPKSSKCKLQIKQLFSFSKSAYGCKPDCSYHYSSSSLIHPHTPHPQPLALYTTMQSSSHHSHYLKLDIYACCMHALCQTPMRLTPANTNSTSQSKKPGLGLRRCHAANGASHMAPGAGLELFSAI
jgi:hypothetical protein